MKPNGNEITKDSSEVRSHGQEQKGGKEKKEEVNSPDEQEKKEGETEKSKQGVKRLQPEDSDEEFQFDPSAPSKAMKKLKAMKQRFMKRVT